MPRHFQDAPPEIRTLVLQVRRLFARAAQFRGTYLHVVADIDVLLTDILAFLLSGPDPKRFAMANHVLTDAGRITLGDKIDLLIPLIRMADRDAPKRKRSLAMTWAANVPEAKALEDLVSRLHQVRKLRNRLAHVALDASGQFLDKKHEDRIQLRWFEEGREKTHVITKREMKQQVEVATSVVISLLGLAGGLGLRQIQVRPPRERPAETETKE
jgi:hypothetical protein